MKKVRSPSAKKEEKKVAEQEGWMILLMEGKQEDSNWKIDEVEERKRKITHTSTSNEREEEEEGRRADRWWCHHGYERGIYSRMNNVYT